MALIPFPPYAPDLNAIGLPVSSLVSGCVPKGNDYSPFPQLSVFTAALPAGCRGYYYARRSDGSIAVFAGTINRLYLLNNTTLVWEDVSKGGAAYPDLLSDDNWVMVQFNNLVIAVHIGTAPQVFDLSGAAFADLGGSPPIAHSVAVINRIVVLTGLASNPRRVHWSDVDAPTTWTAGVGLCDFQDLPNGGQVVGIAGGDSYGVVFQEQNARRFIYAPGSPYTFQINQIGEGEVLLGQYSPISVSDRVFYVTASGFKMLVGPGSEPIPIGKDQVDSTFLDDIDKGSLRMLHSAVDPGATRVYFAYKSQQGQADLVDKVLSFDWMASGPRKWTVLPIIAEMIGSLAAPGITLEALDAIAPTPLEVVDAVAGGGGRVRLELNALSNADFSLVDGLGAPSQNFIRVYDVAGTVEANGTWPYTIVSTLPPQIELTGSVFANAYVSGGQIGGSLDALPFSLDTVSVAAQASLSAVRSDHKIGFFDGPNMEAIIETGETDEDGAMVFIDEIRPLTDCYTMQLSLGWRNRAQDAVAYTAETGIGVTGKCNIPLEARHIKGRARFPAGATWGYARGLQPKAMVAGDS